MYLLCSHAFVVTDAVSIAKAGMGCNVTEADRSVSNVFGSSCAPLLNTDGGFVNVGAEMTFAAIDYHGISQCALRQFFRCGDHS
jgi:hypothetical protein